MIRKPLGRGLDALIGNVAAPIEAVAGAEDNAGGQFRMAPVGSITPGAFQPRINFDKERLAELTLAIQSQGIIEPLIVRRIDAPENDGPRYELIAGERRLRAARAAGLETVPVVVRELDDRAALEMSLVENIVRENLNAVEEGLAFFRLVDHFGLTHDQVAARVGKSRSYVSNSIRLLELPQEILNDLPAGISVSKVTDQAVNIREAVDEFMLKFFVALAVVMIVSIISLGWRVGIVVAAAVPLTLAAVFVIMLPDRKSI